MDKVRRAAWAATLEQYKPSGILVSMLVMIGAVIILALYLASDEPSATEEFIATVQRVQVDKRDGKSRRLLIVRVATGESVTLQVADDVTAAPGEEVRVSRGVGGGGRMIYEFAGHLGDR
mgnify:CR=1 FL=1